MTDITKVVEDGINGVQDKIGGELKAAIDKFEGQLAEKGNVASEAKDAVIALSKKFEDAMTEIGQKMDSAKSGEMSALSAGEEFVKSERFTALAEGKAERVRLEVKNTVTAVSGTTTFPQQNQQIVPGEFKPLTIRQLFRAIPVSTNMVTSMRELSWTNSAAEVSQGAAKNESDVTFEQYNVPITTVAHWLKVSNQLLADAPAVISYINTRLRDGLAQRIDAQLLNGNGTSPNLSGLTDSGNFTTYTPTSDDTLVDAINRAKYLLWAKGYTPDTVIVNPADWGAMERLRETSGGAYLYGMPGAAAGVNPFGVRVVLSANMASGYFWVGSISRVATLWERQGSVIEMGFVDKDFTNNLVTIRAEERLGLGTDVPSAAYYGLFTTT